MWCKINGRLCLLSNVMRSIYTRCDILRLFWNVLLCMYGAWFSARGSLQKFIGENITNLVIESSNNEVALDNWTNYCFKRHHIPYMA
jgi:hypothetical protein